MLTHCSILFILWCCNNLGEKPGHDEDDVGILSAPHLKVKNLEEDLLKISLCTGQRDRIQICRKKWLVLGVIMNICWFLHFKHVLLVTYMHFNFQNTSWHTNIWRHDNSVAYFLTISSTVPPVHCTVLKGGERVLWVPPREDRMNLEGQAFLWPYDLAPRPPPPPPPFSRQKAHTERLRRRDNLMTKGGGRWWVKSPIIRPQESLYKSFNNFWTPPRQMESLLWKFCRFLHNSGQ